MTEQPKKMKGFRLNEQTLTKFDKTYHHWVLIELESGQPKSMLTEAAFMDQIIGLMYTNAFGSQEGGGADET